MLCGDVFAKNLIFLKNFIFYFITFNFFMLLLLLDLKGQSEHPGLRPDTSSPVVPIFDTKVTEYLCSGWVFFFRQISTF